MNPEQPGGILIGVLLGRVAVGGICGLIPLVLGFNRHRQDRGIAGFFITVVAGLIGGVLLATPVAGALAVWATRSRTPESPEAGAMAEPTAKPARRLAHGWLLVIIFFVETIILTTFWSMFMAIWMGKSFLEILIPSGAFFGLTVGTFLTVAMAITTRTGSVTIPFQDRDAFLERLGGQIQKFRYHALEADETSMVYEPRALLRSEGTRIHIALGSDAATITGPWASINALKKHLEKS